MSSQSPDDQQLWGQSRQPQGCWSTISNSRRSQQRKLRRTFWQRYETRTGKAKISLGWGIYLVALLLCSCVGATLASGCLSSTMPPTQKPIPLSSQQAARRTPVPLADTTENIHPGMAHDSKQNVSSEKGTVDYVWGSDTPGQPSGIHKSFYFKFDRVGGYPGNISFPIYYDKSWFLANHPDWLVYLCDQTTLAYEFGDPNVPLDITNPGVLKFMLENWIYPALDRGYDGIAFDNVNLDNKVSSGRCGIWKTNSNEDKAWVYLYGDAASIHGPDYLKSIIYWAKFMYSTIHTYKPGATMEMNFCPDNGGVPSQPLSFNEQLLPYTDLAFNEGGYTNGGDSFTTDANWQKEIGFSHDLASLGKGQLITFGFSFSSLTQQQKQWILSNYLLAKGIHTYVYIASLANNGSNYGDLNIIPEYSIKVGHPINAMYQSQGVYIRDYSSGKTIVNPSSSQSFTVMFPTNTYKDFYGNTINSPITLQAHSGVVLVSINGPISTTLTLTQASLLKGASAPRISPTPLMIPGIGSRIIRYRHLSGSKIGFGSALDRVWKIGSLPLWAANLDCIK